MIIEAKFKNELKKMMSEMPLENINVTSLCGRCKCHRQTFYYHYQDIYDLVASIFLNENVEEVEKATNIKDVLLGFIEYCKHNFSFLKSTYNSGAHELSDAFVFNIVMQKVFTILSSKYEKELNMCRIASRRFANFVSNEFSYVFKDKDLTVESLENIMSQFIENSVKDILPAFIELSRKELK